MSEKQTIDLNLVELVNIAAQILDQLFIKAPREKAKSVFKDIKQGHSFALGSVEIQKVFKPSLALALDYSEFVGPGYNFDIFQAALKGILLRISEKFQQQGDLNILTGEDNSLLIHLPGFVQQGQQVNAMVMAFDMAKTDIITIRLMFIDPGQYQSQSGSESAADHNATT